MIKYQGKNSIKSKKVYVKSTNRVRKAEIESFDRHRKKESKVLSYIDIFKGRSVHKKRGGYYSLRTSRKLKNDWKI